MFPTPPPTLHTLSPPHARLCLAVNRFLTTEMDIDTKGYTVVVGLSGGADSTALLLILFMLRHKLGISLAAAHLDHAIRTISADEAEYCRCLCAWLSIPFHTHREDVPKLSQTVGLGLEETARKARYTFFAEVLQQYPAAWLALGHQLNDLAEDVLMRLMRGTGWPALGGMPAKDANRSLCRPLLLTPREKLEELLHAMGIPFLHDASNDDLAYLRNRVRHQILPLFIQENPAFLKNIAALWQLRCLDEELFASLLQQAGAPLSAITSHLIPKAVLEQLTRPLRLRLFKVYVEQNRSHALMPNLLRLDDAWLAKKTGSSIQFPQGVTASIDKGSVVFQKFSV